MQLVAAFSGHLLPLLGRQALLGLRPSSQQLVKGGMAYLAGCGVSHLLGNLQWED